MNPTSSLAKRSYSSGVIISILYKCSRQHFPATSEFKEPISYGSRYCDSCSFSSEMDLFTLINFWSCILSNKSKQQLDTAPYTLSWFTEWMVRIISSIFPDLAVTWIVFLLHFRFQVSQLSTLISRNKGWVLCTKKSIIPLTSWIHFSFVFEAYVPFHFSSSPGSKINDVLTEISFSLTFLIFKSSFLKLWLFK